MSRLSRFAAFIFDMDGLVLDTEPAYFEAWRLALGALGYQTEAHFFRSFSGYRFAQIQEKLIEKFGDNFDVQHFKAIASCHWRNHVETHGIVVKAGVTELLDYAAVNGVPVAIATNSPASNAHECLELAGIKHRFPVIVTGDDVECPKPAPDIFLAAANRLKVDIRHCIVFEDSPTGVVAASGAGACCAFIPSTFPVDPVTDALCDHRFDDLLQLLQSLAKPSVNGL